MEKIAIGADHAGYELKERVVRWLEKNGYQTKDFGTYSITSVDYPDFAHPVASAIEKICEFVKLIQHRADALRCDESFQQ